MIRKNIGKPKTSIKTLETIEGETIEQKIERIVSNKEPISDGAPIIYMERKDGIRPEFDVRTDRFDVAIDAMDKVSKSKIAKREAKLEVKKSDASAETIQGTEQSKKEA